MSELALLPAAELRRRILRRELSPVEVTEACLAQVERHNEEINAVVTLNDRALEEARALEKRLAGGEDPGPLSGLPVGIKDVTETAGIRTTYGSPLYADFVPDEDALVVRRFREAGAVILGKTNTPEFAAGGNTFNEVFGRTRNPWDPERSAGGSTGGGAAGLVTGMIALAQGTDLGGSLRIPASFCGVVGLRPSPGLVPTYPARYLWDDLQVTGTMARTAEDVALSLAAVAGPSPLSPLAQPTAGRDFVAVVRRGPPERPYLAFCPDIAGIGIDPEMDRVCRESLESLAAAGAEVEEIELDLSYGRDAFLELRGLWFVAQMYDELDRIDAFGPNVSANLRSGLAVTTRELGAAEAARHRMREEFRDLFDRFDHLLTPCMAVPPFPVEENYPAAIGGREMETYVDWIAPTFVLSLTGLPVGSVPCGLDSAGLPVGLQIVGPPMGEESVLALAGHVQALRPLGHPAIVGSRAADRPRTVNPSREADR
ncbi:MAG: amidase [Gemmatimonadota bacterium]